MNRALGIILTGGRNDKLKELASKRSVAALAYGGRYRAIDFVLSNMVNSGITQVGVMTQYSYRSLMDHIGSGKEWDLDRRSGGLFMFPPSLSQTNSGWYKGSADSMYNNMSFLRKSNAEYAIITTGNCIYKMNYNKILKDHIESEANITVCYRDMYDLSNEDLTHLGIIELDDNERIIDMTEKSKFPKTSFASLGVYVVRVDLLMTLLEEAASQGYYDFVRDIIIKNIGHLDIKGFKFKGYWRSMHSVELFYKTNMEALNPEVRDELFFQNGKVYTKVKDQTPAKYNEEAVVSNSIIADGCIIEGTVENSVLFRGVRVHRGAVIKDSIIMQDTSIGENAKLNNVIVDKEVKISNEKELIGDVNYPFIVGKGVKI